VLKAAVQKRPSRANVADRADVASTRKRRNGIDLQIAELYAGALYAGGMTDVEVGEFLGVSKRQAKRYREVAGVRARVWPRPMIHPEPGQRECECGCGRVFRPRPRVAAAGYGRFFSRECADRCRDGERLVTEKAAGIEQAKQYRQARGRWNLSEAAAFLGRSPGALAWYEDMQLLEPVERVLFGPHRETLYEPKVVKRFGRELVLSDSYRVRFHRDPAWVLRWALKRGATLAAAEALSGRVAERNARLAKIRAGKGQPAPMRPHHERWREAYNAEPDFDYAEGRKLTRQERLRAVALADWQTYPEIWPRAEWPSAPGDPDGLADFRRAAHRVDAAIKALEIV
jgi:hypothetical protein